MPKGAVRFVAFSGRLSNYNTQRTGLRDYLNNWNTIYGPSWGPLNLSYDVDLVSGKGTREEIDRHLVGAGRDEQTLSICIGYEVLGCLSIFALVGTRFPSLPQIEVSFFWKPTRVRSEWTDRNSGIESKRIRDAWAR